MSFNELPTEILFEIGKYANQNLRKLSSSADQALAVALGPRKQLVRTIRFVPHDPRPHEDETPDQGIKLSDKARQVLGSLHKFPKLEKVQFDWSTWRMDQWDPVLWRVRDISTGVLGSEAEPWRHLIDQSLRALTESHQNHGAFACLEMKALPPTDDSWIALTNKLWHRLAERLETFKISLAVTRNGQHMYSIRPQKLMYPAFHGLFFWFLTSVKFLRIVATEEAVISSRRVPFRDTWSRPINWNPVQLSKLETFELEFSVIGEGLIDFLGRHAQTLKRITLRYCFTHRKDDWRRLFQLFISIQPVQLTVFELQAYPVRLWRGQTEREWQRLEPISGFEILANTREDEMRRFVVADATDDCDKIRPIESLIGSTTDHVDVSELDESDLIPLWEEVGRLLERNS